MTTDGIRRDFLDFFESKAHRVVKSSSLVPHNDNTILFTNAGMNQFKHVFTGEEKKDFKRAVSCQKCVRAGGKHNDLENVGYTARHHTFFEMLGNFSFGDYFKEEAIEYAWEFVTKRLDLPPERLSVSVYKKDDAAHEIWNKRIGLPEKKILRLGEKDNFWAMGDTGPCGPCSEIHYDNGAGTGCGKKTCSVACDCDRFVEIWNLVFMEYNRDESGKMTPLPKPSIDTGMGLERVSAIKHGVISNYDIDIFKPLISHLCGLSGRKYEKSDEETRISIRAIADHARASTFLISEGIVPSNEGRGYVLRRIIRRALRHGYLLGIKEAFLWGLVDGVVKAMGGFYTELSSEASSVKAIVKNEEESFLKTSAKGLEILTLEVEKLLKTNKKIFPGKKAFDLYSTYGFPLDLTEDALKKHKLKVDAKEFEESFEEHRNLAKGSFKDSQAENGIGGCELADLKVSVFMGYEKFTVKDAVINYISHDKESGTLKLVFDKTPFYGESGGQKGDRGTAYNEKVRIEIINTVKTSGGHILHLGKLLEGGPEQINVGDRFTVEVDAGQRLATMRNHTATHLLHKALRRHLGNHVKQAGSFVEAARLRFDFSHTQSVPRDVLRMIEDEVNSKILANLEVKKEEMPIDKARELGAMALFGEKYADTVRVIRIKEGPDDYSIELCGGTHVQRTGDIGLMKITAESSIASGIRRIEAVTGKYAVKEFRRAEDMLWEAAQILKTTPEEVAQRASKNIKRLKELERLKSTDDGSYSAGNEDLLKQIKDIKGCKVLAAEVATDDPKKLRTLADTMLDRIKNGIIVLGARKDDKAFLIAKVSKDLTGRYSAKKIIGEISKIIGGGGGGKDEIAEAGGSKPENLALAIKKVGEILS